MWTVLDIFIGLALCYALISLFCSVIQEFIAQALDSRGKLLVEALKDAKLNKVITSAQANLVKNPGWLFRIPWFTNWGSFTQSGVLRKGVGEQLDEITGGRRLPHDVSAADLTNALLNGSTLIAQGKVATDFDNTVSAMALPDGLKSRLLNLSAAVRADVDMVKKEIEQWFGDFIGQVQHWYVRRAQAMSMVIGFVVAAGLNVDTIDIATTLYHDPAKRESSVKLAAQVVEKDGDSTLCKAKASAEKPKPVAGANEGQAVKAAAPADSVKAPSLAGERDRVKDCLKEIEKFYPVPIGWDKKLLSDFKDEKKVKYPSARHDVIAAPWFVWDQLWGKPQKFLGILLTALALSLGSRFWFDLLKNLVALRTGGQPDKPKKKDE